MTLAVGLDLGSTTIKAVLVEVSATGDVFSRHVARRPSTRSPRELLTTAADVVRECVARSEAPIAALGVAALGESGAALDAGGEPITPLLRWDARIDPAHVLEVLARRPNLPAATGIPATTKPAAVVLTALRAERPQVFLQTRQWAGAADLVAHALTGSRFTDHTLAARTMLSRDSGSTWDSGILQDLDLPVGILPEVHPVDSEPVRTNGAAHVFGLAAGIPVFVAGHDHVVGAWAAGIRRPGAVADSLGTAEAVVRVADAVDVDAAVSAGFAVGRTVDATAWTILGGSPACGALLSWWEAEYPADRPLERLGSAAAARWRPADTLVLPYPAGRRCPHPDPHARLHIAAAPAAGAGDRARGLLQSLVFQARWMREAQDDLAGATARSVVVLGSLAERIPVWAPLTAASGVPTRLCTTAEPVAAGAGLLAAVRAGVAPPDAVLSTSAVDPARTVGLDAAYARFLQAALTDLDVSDTLQGEQ